MKMQPKALVERFKTLKSGRSTLESHLQEVGDYFLPNNNNIITTREKGSKTNTHLLDSTGMEALFLLASFLQGALTSPNGQWFEYTTGVEALDKRDNVRRWLQEVVRRMHVVINDSNFQTEVHNKYLNVLSYGTGCLGTFEEDSAIVRFKSEHIADFVMEENHLGVVDRIYHSIKWNVDQIAEHFGPESLSETMKREAQKNPTKEYEIIHGVYREVGGTTWFSQYVLVDEDRELFDRVTNKTAIYQEFPYAVVRFSKSNREIYGRSPAMNALPDMKILNKMTETEVRAAQRVSDPPLQATDDGVVLPIKTAPGSINFVRPGSDPIRPIFEQVAVDFGFEALAERRQRIKSAFYVDELKLAQQDRMTAMEVAQRTEQAGMLLGPMLARYATEFLPSMTDRVFNIMFRRGLFERPPEELQGLKIRARYTSMIARSQRMQDAQNIVRTIEAVAPYLQLDPSIADNFIGDEVLRHVARAFNFPQDAIRNEDERDMIREQRAAAQQEQANLMQSQQQAEIANTVAGAQAQSSRAQTGTR